MRGIIKKDLYLERKNIFLCLGVYSFMAVIAIVAVIFAKNDLVFAKEFDLDTNNISMCLTMLVFLMVFFLQGKICGIDEKRKWSYFGTSTPLTEKGLVASRYTLIFMIASTGVVICFCFDVLISLITGIHTDNTIIYMMLLFVNIAYEALELPFIIRYGSSRGTNVKVAVLLSVFFFVILYALFGDISGWVEFFKKLKDNQDIAKYINGEAITARLLNMAAPKLLMATLLPHIIVLFYYISYRISCKLYLKGTEEYDA